MKTFDQIVNDSSNFDDNYNLKDSNKLADLEMRYQYQSSKLIERKRMDTFKQKVIY